MKNILISAVVAAFVVLLGFAFYPKGESPVGSASSPSVVDGYMDVNGVVTYQERKALNLASSTMCAIKSPTATSTLLRSIVQVNTATSTETTWTIAKSASAFATTTALQPDSVLATTKRGTIAFMGTTTAISTTMNIDNVQVVAPNQYVVWSASGFLPADTTKLNGVCSAVFQLI